MKARDLDRIALVSLFAGALAIRIVFVRGFDGLYGQDAYAYFNAAAEIIHGATISPYYWGIGYPVLLISGFALFGVSAWAAQAITMVCGAAIAPLVYVLAGELRMGRRGAVFAALIILISAQSIQSSIVVMSDIPALAGGLISAVCVCRYANGGRGTWLIGAGVFLTLAGITRWLYFGLLPIWILFVILKQSPEELLKHKNTERKEKREKWGSIIGGRISVRDGILALIAAGFVMLPQIGFAALHPTPVIDYAWVQNWSIGNALQKDFVNVDGVFHFTTINAQFYAAPLIDPVYMTPLLLPFAVLGAWRLRKDRAAFILINGWLSVPYMFLIGIPYQNIRFSLISVPAAALLIGAGFEALKQTNREEENTHPKTFEPQRHKGHREKRQSLGGVAAGLAIAVIGLAIMASRSNEYVSAFVARQNADRAVVMWAAETIPDAATVYTMGLTLPLRMIHPGEVRELYYETDQTLQAVDARREPAYLLVNMWQIENQWQGRAPALAIEWLRRERGMQKIGQNGYYALYWISP